MSKIDPAQDARVERQSREFLKNLIAAGGKPMEEMQPGEARGVLEGAQQSVEVELPQCEVDRRIIMQDGVEAEIYIVRPPGIDTKLPVFMFFHGGGWVLGDFATHERFVRDLVFDSECAAVFVEYTRSPEARYPVAINQAYAATKWVAEHGDEANLDGSRIAVVGNSAGGNITAAVTLMAKDRNGPELKFQVLFWPVTDANFETGSYNEFANGYFLTKGMMKWFWNNYLPDPGLRSEIYASPLRGTPEQLKGLPPALIQTAGNDVLRDEGEAYASKLDAAGVEVTLVRYAGMIHDYGLLNPLAGIPAVRAALAQVAAELRKRLA